MPRVNMNDLNKYSSGGGGGRYFSIKKDKEVKAVRFMINDAEDMNDYIYVVHEVKETGDQYPKSVNCLREYNDPIDECPLCASGNRAVPKLFLPVCEIDDDEKVKIWQRSSAFVKKMTSFCSRYKDLVSHVVEVERNGKPNDQKTTYELYETDRDDTTLEDLPEVPEILGTYVLDKTAEDMEFFLQEGQFPPDDEEEEAPRRRSRKQEPEEDEDDEPPFEEEEEKPRRRERERRSEREDRPARRTPAKNRKSSKEDRF